MYEPNLDIYKVIPPPRDYYSGFSSAFKTPPREVLAFYRGAAEEAVRHGDRSLHHRFVLCVCVESDADMIVEDKLFTVNPGWALLLFPHQPHHFARFAEQTISWVFVSFELDDDGPILELRNAPVPLSGEAWGLINKVVQCYLDGLRGEEARRHETVHWLCLLLGRLVMERRRDDAPPLPEGNGLDPRRERVRRIAEHVHRNLDKALPLTDIASRMACSESLLRKEFREGAGISLGRFIRRARITKACRLLHTSRLSVAAIAEECGFASPAIFSRAFKNAKGFSPLEYRKRAQADQSWRPSDSG